MFGKVRDGSITLSRLVRNTFVLEFDKVPVGYQLQEGDEIYQRRDYLFDSNGKAIAVFWPDAAGDMPSGEITCLRLFTGQKVDWCLVLVPVNIEDAQYSSFRRLGVTEYDAPPGKSYYEPVARDGIDAFEGK